MSKDTIDSTTTVTEPKLDYQTLNLMRWDNQAAVLSFRTQVVMLPEVHAYNVLRSTKKGKSRTADKRMSSFLPGNFPLHAILEATEVAAHTARNNRIFTEFEVVVVGEIWKRPMLENGANKFSPLPPEWFLDEEKARNIWLLASQAGKQVIAPAQRPACRLVNTQEVWVSTQSVNENVKALATFNEHSLIGLH